MSLEHLSKHTDNIEIRDYRLSSDFQAVAELLASEGMFNPERDRYERLKKLEYGGTLKNMKVAVAMGERIVGSLYINGGIGVVEGIVVHPDFRRQGVGRQLVQAAMDQLRKDGHRSMELQIDEDREDLRAWYESLGFKRTYHVVGMMQPLEPEPVFELSEVVVDRLDRSVVSQAFMDVYMRYRPRTRFKYREPIQSRDEIEMTHEGVAEIRRRFPKLNMRQFMDDYTHGAYNQPAISAEEKPPKLRWEEVDGILRKSSIPPLRAACFHGWAWGASELSAWIVLPHESNDANTELVQSWLGKHTEYPKTLVWRVDVDASEFKTLMDRYYPIPNNNFLFLRQIKGIRRFGCPPSLDGTRIDGDFLCHDQANNNTFAFRIKDNLTELLTLEETAVMLEELVRYARDYEQLAEAHRPK